RILSRCWQERTLYRESREGVAHVVILCGIGSPRDRSSRGRALSSFFPPPPPTQGRRSTPMPYLQWLYLCDTTAATGGGRRPAPSTHRLSGPLPGRGGPRRGTSLAPGPSGCCPGRLEPWG